MKKTKTHAVIQRLIPPLAVWAVGKMLATPRVHGALQEIDSRAYAGKRNTLRTIRRAGKNARSNAAWVAAGAAAIAIGIGLIAKATRG